MWMLRKPKLIPLLATLGVMALFALAISIGQTRHVVKQADLNTYDVAGPAPRVMEPPPPVQSSSAPAVATQVYAPPSATEGGPDGPAAGPIAPVEVSIPKLAYAYTLGFRLPGDRIARAQEAHRARCERMGLARCQLLALSRGTADDTTGEASLKLRVASAEARSFSDAVIEAVTDAGGRAVSTSLVAEDVSKDIVDAEARIRQRELLVARLTEILRTRSGKVAELVEAERSVAEAQEELDKTKGWLTELRGRVAMSEFEIRYTAVAPTASPARAGNQLGEAVTDSGVNFLIGIKGVLTLLIYLLPWLLLAIPFALVFRRVLRRWERPGGGDPPMMDTAADEA